MITKVNALKSAMTGLCCTGAAAIALSVIDNETILDTVLLLSIFIPVLIGDIFYDLLTIRSERRKTSNSSD